MESNENIRFDDVMYELLLKDDLDVLVSSYTFC